MKKLLAHIVLLTFIGVLSMSFHEHNHHEDHCAQDHQGQSVLHENHIEAHDCVWCYTHVSVWYTFQPSQTHISAFQSNSLAKEYITPFFSTLVLAYLNRGPPIN